MENEVFTQTQHFAATYANLSALLAFVVQTSHTCGFDQAAIDEIEVAVGEACSNIIRHGYGGEGVGEISCTCLEQSTAFYVILRDQAQPFDPVAHPVRDPADAMRRLVPGGWGIFLMRCFVDELHYRREHEASNVLTMIKHKESRKKWQLQPEPQGM